MNRIIKKMGLKGLIVIGFLFVITVVCIFAFSPKAGMVALAAAALPFFGMATGDVVDSMARTRTLTYTHNAALSSGDVIVVNGAVLVAVNDTDANAENVFVYEGKVALPKTAALAIDALDAVYWDAAAGECNKTAAGNTACGFCQEAAAGADSTVTIMLLPTIAILSLSQMSSNVIADPGNAGAIPVAAAGVVEIVTAGAETRTLAAPSFIGQVLEICMKTDGGDCVITCATTVNQTGNNTITLNDAGDCVTLIAKQNGANLRWSVVANDGATLSTV
jgi:predicted RecA/RadA family phage recombinase